MRPLALLKIAALVVLVDVLLAVVAIGIARADAPAVTLDLNPIEDVIGSVTTATGAGFVPDDLVKIVWHIGATLRMAEDRWYVTADSAGGFTAQLTIPSNALIEQPNKIVAASVDDPSGSHVAQALFFVHTTGSAFVCKTADLLKQCLWISGTGRFVSSITGYVTNPFSGKICGSEKLYKNGSVYKSVTLCPLGHKTASHRWSFGTNFPNKTTFCTDYHATGGRVSGKPCATVSG